MSADPNISAVKLAAIANSDHRLERIIAEHKHQAAINHQIWGPWFYPSLSRDTMLRAQEAKQ
jgi:hypothetical protein